MASKEFTTNIISKNKILCSLCGSIYCRIKLCFLCGKPPILCGKKQNECDIRTNKHTHFACYFGPIRLSKDSYRANWLKKLEKLGFEQK